MSLQQSHTSSSAGHAEVGHHVPLWVLVVTLLALLALTFVTYAATWVDFGRSINLWIAIIIATIKAILVALIFMHLAYDKPFNAVVLICTLLFVMLFIGLSIMDSVAYQDQIQEYRDADPVRYAPEIYREQP